jgi:transcriptional regulator with XRE-family HTH domain
MKNNVKKIRQEKKLTQLALSIRTEIQQSDISQIENHKKVCFPKWEDKIAAALGEKKEVVFPN